MFTDNDNRNLYFNTLTISNNTLDWHDAYRECSNKSDNIYKYTYSLVFPTNEEVFDHYLKYVNLYLKQTIATLFD